MVWLHCLTEQACTHREVVYRSINLSTFSWKNQEIAAWNEQGQSDFLYSSVVFSCKFKKGAFNILNMLKSATNSRLWWNVQLPVSSLSQLWTVSCVDAGENEPLARIFMRMQCSRRWNGERWLVGELHYTETSCRWRHYGVFYLATDK